MADHTTKRIDELEEKVRSLESELARQHAKSDAVTMEMALATSEFLEVLRQLMDGDFSVLASEQSSIELFAVLGKTINETIRRLSESEEKWRSLVENAPDVISLVDREGRLLFANRTLTGIPSERVVGTSVYGTTTADGHQKMRSAIERVFETGEPDGFEVASPGPGGATLHWASRMGPVMRHDQVVAAIIISTDITKRRVAQAEQRRLEAQIQHAQKLESLGVLAGGIAHDFNNLLTGILGNADLALLTMSPVAPGRRCVDSIADSSRRAAELCKQMLAYSGKGSFVVGRLDLREVVEEMTHLLGVSVTKMATLKYDFQKKLPTFEGDATQIRQVVMNLIINASEAIGEDDGVISVHIGSMQCDRAYLDQVCLDEQLSEGTYVFLEVSDTGCGMEEETIAKVFDPFFSTKFTGRGLGLSAVLGIIRGHSGGIKIYSEPGKGSMFKVLFPAVEQPAAKAACVASGHPEWRGSGTVLLVDDEQAVRDVGTAMLESLGFAVLTCSDGHEAIEMFRAHAGEIRCVILDLTMPHMDGRQAFRHLRSIDEEVRIILSSGYNEAEISDKFVGKQLAGFLQKPYRVSDLVSTLRRALAD